MSRALFFTARARGMTTLLVAALGLAACGGPVAAPAAPKREADGAAYLAPPTVTAAKIEGAQATVNGVGAPGAQVRLATPGGEALLGKADAAGLWRLSEPARPQAALYGLSQTLDGRTMQAEGYLLITPQGQALQLRAGGGALAIGTAPQVGLTAFDIDRDGGAVVSGHGAPGSAVSARVDGRKLGEGRVDQAGRFSLSLSGPVSPGSHSLKVFGDGLDVSLTVDATPAAPLTDGPFRTTPTAAGLRVDWMTPGGGVQSTLVARSPAGEPPGRDLP